MRSAPRHSLLRLSAAALLAAGLGGGTAIAASADPAPPPLPAPLDTAVTDITSQLQSAAPTLPGAGDSTGALTRAVEGVAAQLPAAPGSGEPNSSAPVEAEPASSPGAAAGSQAGSNAGVPASRAKASAAEAPAAETPGSVAVGTPVVSACLIPTGSASPAFEIDLSAAGVDLSSPLIEQIPQAFTACPKGAVAAGPNLASVDAAIEGLLGACVRVTTEVAPLQTTLIILDRNVIEELTGAGVPLGQLAVPCPGGSTGGTGPGADNGDPDRAGTASGQSQNAAASAIPGLPDRLAFTGSSIGPALATAVGLLCLGSLLMRKAALLALRR
jgi:hypothetical protein